MKSLFEKDTCDELYGRLASLNSECKREWGKMTPCQAMEHTARVLEMATSDEQPIRQIFLGKALGGIYARWCTRSMAEGAAAHFRRTAPTASVV